MSRANIFEVKTLADLRDIITLNVTVVVGVTIPDTDKDLKIFIRKFLKRQSERFHLITFVYIDIPDELRGQLNILSGSDEDFPKVVHIRDGNGILAMVTGATPEMIIKNFGEVDALYTREMNEVEEYINKNKKTDNNTVQQKSKQALKTKTQTTPENDNTEDGNQDTSRDTKQQTQPNQVVVLSPEIEKKIKLEKLVFLTKKSDAMKIEIVKEVMLSGV